MLVYLIFQHWDYGFNFFSIVRNQKRVSRSYQKEEVYKQVYHQKEFLCFVVDQHFFLKEVVSTVNIEFLGSD
jgi:hypothetical protein